MASISIEKRHHLTHAKAKAAAMKIAKDLEKRFGLDYEWDGDNCAFERPGLTGHMHVAKDRIALHVTLGFLLSALKPSIEKEIHAQLDQLLGKPKA